VVVEPLFPADCVFAEDEEEPPDVEEVEAAAPAFD
jgi:hypothetical protein